MPGWLSNGFQQVQARIQQSVTIAPVPQTILSSASALVPFDTEQAAGQPPQTVNATPFQIASAAGALIQNTATSTTHTATLNTKSGLMLTESLSTAAGATYTFQLVNSLIVSASSPIPQVQMHDGTNVLGDTEVTSITNAAGTATVVFTNIGSVAWSGTKIITFHV